MKEILYIGAGAPWLGGAGYLLRQRMFLRALSQVGRLNLAMFDPPPGAADALPDFVAGFTALPKVLRKSESGVFRLGADLLCPVPRMFRGSRPQAARKIVAGLHPEHFDAVFAFRIDFAHFAGVLGHPRLLLDIDDPEHLRWRRQLAATASNGGDWRTLHDLNKLARFEKNAARSARAAFVCQENDRAPFQPPPIVVPNCVDVPPSLPSRRAETPRIIFVGNFAAASPNADALRWVLEAIWPRIQSAVPQCQLQVVGRLSGELEARVRGTAGAIAAGFVQDLPAAMAEASLSIAPIRFGTGTRVKIIESFALGCPVVSTTLGAEGIDALPGKEILLGDTPEAFAEQCVTLLRDPAAQSRLAAAAYEVAATRYNEEARRKDLVAALAALLEDCEAAAVRSSGRKAPGRIAAL